MASFRISEEELVTGLRNRQRESLRYLYDHYAAALHGIIFRIVQHEEIAEEILQDVFLKIWEKIGSYDAGKGKLFTWMLNIARNQAIDKTRSKEIGKGRKTDDLDNLVHKVDRQDYATLPVDAIGLKDLMAKLSEEQRFVVEYLYLKGYTHSELAEEFAIPLGTVKTRLRLALIELRTILGLR